MKGRLSARAAALALLLCLGLPPMPAQAVEPEEENWNGYLFCVSADTPMLLSEAEGVEPVWPELGLYRADTLDDVEAFAGGCAVYVEPDYEVTLLELPDDPLCGQQWSLEALGVEAAWDWGLDGTGVRIGIVDSGVMAGHEDLQGANILAGHNYLDGGDDVSDDYGHGTFVTGLIAAQRGNGVGIAGLAEGAEIVPLKCFSGKTTSVSVIVSAIRGAVDTYHCDILNMSFGLASESETMKDAVEYASQAGVILVAAAGNTGGTAPNYPASYDCVIGVGSVDQELNCSSFSQHNTSVYVTAPGQDIQSLTITDERYISDKGTSYSCPMVTSAIALLKQADGTLTPQEILELLADTAIDLGEEGYDTLYGHGLVYLPAMLRGLEALRPTSLTVSGGELSVSGFGGYAPTEQIYAAAYREDGKLLECVPVERGLLLDSRWVLPEGTAAVKLLVLSETDLSPLRGALCWEAARRSVENCASGTFP